MHDVPRYPGIRLTTYGNQLVSYHTEARVTDGGIFYPITASTEMGENYQLAYAEGRLNVFGGSKVAVETEGEHSAQGGAIAFSRSRARTPGKNCSASAVVKGNRTDAAPAGRSAARAACAG